MIRRPEAETSQKNMKLAEFQALQTAAHSRYATSKERAELQADLAEKIKRDPVRGTIFLPVFFGCGQSKGEAAANLAALRSITQKQARAEIKSATLSLPCGRVAYTRADVAAAIGSDHVGMGSCTLCEVCESDPDAAHDADISVMSGPGWRRV